jgi:hypothetical protein
MQRCDDVLSSVLREHRAGRSVGIVGIRGWKIEPVQYVITPQEKTRRTDNLPLLRH